MRRTASAAACALALCLARDARAVETDPGLAVLAGAATAFAAFAVGGLVIAANRDDRTANAGGWLTMEGGFVLAPFVAHGLVGEWARGAAFAAAPALATGGTAALFELEPPAATHGTRSQERVLWALFGAGLLSSAIGVVDAAFARDRAHAVRLSPTVGAGGAGLSIEGSL